MLKQLDVTPEVGATKINNMKENKSPGVDGISPEILKETVEQISTPLVYVFNISLQVGIVPLNGKKQTSFLYSNKRFKNEVCKLKASEFNISNL